MKSSNFLFFRAFLFIAAASVGVVLSGCTQPGANTVSVPPSNAPVNSQPVTNTNANSNVAAPAQPSESLAKVPLTLPMVDAILADEAAAAEMKSGLQITDEQIAKLRTSAREAVGELSADSEVDESRSTDASTKAAIAKIREIFGPEKSDAVVNFLRQRWTGSEGQASTSDSATPNSVPTDTRVVVNAPAYRMDIFKDGKLTKTYKIGIGYPEFPLPAGTRKANEIIFNPTWTPPDEPWVKGKFAPGKKVEAGSKDNPLGPIKIPIGSPSLIHGGKAAARLGTFASHGCVGLTNSQVQDFASEISALAGSPISLKDVKGYEKTKTETKNVKLGSPVTVELRYETIVATADGKLTIYRDVYERGTNTEENLRRVLDAAGVSLDTLAAAEKQKVLDGLKKMAMDATGDAINTKDAVMAGDINAMKARGDKVTKNIKGVKQVVFDLAALKGKGYPMPVNLKAA